MASAGTGVRHTGHQGATHTGMGARHAAGAGSGAQGGVVCLGCGSDRSVAGGGGFSDGEGAIRSAEAQREGQGSLTGTDLVAGVDVEQAHVLE